MSSNLRTTIAIYMKTFAIAIPFLFVLVLFLIFYFYGVPNLPAIGTDLSAARGQFGDSFGVLNSLFSGLGFAAVVITLLMQQRQIKTQRIEQRIQQEQIETQILTQAREHHDQMEEKNSQFNLDATIEAYEQAHILLSDGNNDRETWIRAARLLGHAKALGAGVTLDNKKRVLELKRLKYRSLFSKILESKTAPDFYGHQFLFMDLSLMRDPESELTEAAKASTAPEEKNGRRTTSSNHALAEESIHEVWEAAQWPADFDDPIGIKFSAKEREKLIFNMLGLKRYLDHKDQYSSHSGKLTPKAQKDNKE